MFTKEDDLVLGPFIGSGSTALACKQLNHNFIGFEINPNYVKIANKRLNNGGGSSND
jgi:DNA modification methylase